MGLRQRLIDRLRERASDHIAEGIASRLLLQPARAAVEMTKATVRIMACVALKATMPVANDVTQT